MDQKSLYQLYKACRLCGSKGGYKMPIVQNFITVDDTDVELKKKIGDSVQIQVNDGDKMPPLICGICVDKVDEYFAFKELCRQTNEETRKKLGLPLRETDTPETLLYPKKEREDSPKRDIKKEKAQAKREADLKNKETKLKERDIELKSRDKALRVRDIDLKQREAEIKTKESAVKVKETQIKNKDSQLKSFDAILRNKDVELTLKQNQIRAKEQELQQLEETKTQKLKEKEQLLKKKEAELKKKEANLKKMEIEKRKKLDSDRAESRKKESLKRLRESDVDESIVNVQTPRGSRSSSISGRNKLRRSEDRPDGVSGKTTRNMAAVKAISESQEQEELLGRLTRRKEKDVSKSDTTPEKKVILSVNPSSAVITDPAAPIVCEVCSTTFMHLKSLKNHYRKYHSPNTDPKYVCNPCHLWFTNIEAMNSHHSEHKLNNLPYKCSNCEVSFTTAKEYQEHFSALDCYIYTVPDVQCPDCSRFFATETLKSQHRCMTEEEMETSATATDNQGAQISKDSKDQEIDSGSSAPAPEVARDPTNAISEDRNEYEDETPLKTRGPYNVLAEPQVLASLRPVQIRTEKCDQLMKNAEEDLVDVSNVDYNYGLDKSCVYPYFALYPRVKLEPSFNYFRGMVKIHEDVKNDFLLKDYIHWDSEESDNESSESRTSVQNVKTLAELSLKVIFSKKLIGKVPKKRRKVKNGNGSVVNVSLFDLGANCFDYSENMDDSNAACDITDNLTEDDSSANSNDNITRNDLNKDDKNDGEKMETDKQANITDSASNSNKNINIPEHSNDVSLYEEYIKSKNNEEQQNKFSNSETADRDEEVNQSDTNVNNDNEESSTEKTKRDDVDDDSNASHNSAKDDIKDGLESNIKPSLENKENEELKKLSDSGLLKNDVVDNKHDSNEIVVENSSISNTKSTESDEKDIQNELNPSIVTSFVQKDITDHIPDTETETPEVKSDDSNIQQDIEKPLEVETNKSKSVNGNVISENGDQNSIESNADDTKDKSFDKKYDFITHNNESIPFFESNDGPLSVHSNEISDSISDKRTVPLEIENNVDKLDRLSDVEENKAKNEDSLEIDKLMKDLKELSKVHSNPSLNRDKRNNTDDVKTSDVEIDDTKLMAELNEQIGEKDNERQHLDDGVNSEKFENEDGNLESLSVLKKSPSLDPISDEDSNFD